jgi:O-antigen/teichoic acid export membrane protein
MGIVIKQSFWSAIWAAIGLAIGAITTVFLYPRFLSPQQLGLITVLLSAATIFSQFALLGSNSIVYNYATYFNKSKQQTQSFLFFNLKLIAAGALLVSIILIIFKPLFAKWYLTQSPLFIYYYWYLLPFIFGILIYTLFESFIRSHLDIIYTNFSREVLLRILSVLLLFLFYFQWVSFHSFVVFYCLLFGIVAIGLIFYAFYKEYLIWPPVINNTISKKKEMLEYGFYNLLATASWSLIGNIDIMMIASLGAHSLTDAAVYRIATFMSSVIQMPQRTIIQVILPLLAIHWKNNDSASINELYKKASLQLVIMGFFLAMIIFLNIDSILHFLPPVYSNAKWVVFWLACTKIIDMTTSINSEILQTSTKYKYNNLFIMLLLGLTIIANLILIPIYGIIGAAFALCCITSIYNLIKGIFLYLNFRLQPFSANTFKVIFLGILVAGTLYCLPKTDNILMNIIIQSIGSVVGFVIPILFFQWSPEWNQMLKNLLKMIKR